MNKKLIAMLSVFSLCVSMTACSNKSSDTLKESGASSTNTSITTNKNATTLLSKSSEEVETIGDIDTYIKLSDNNTTVEGSGVDVDKNVITINTAGTYSISGKLSDGQIIVNTDKEKKTYILLNGVDITCKSTSPIQILSSEKTVFALADNSENKISDGKTYDKAENNQDAAIFSKEDITFIGNGSLEVNGNYHKGIVSKDDLMIESGSISVKSVTDGIKGKDSVIVRGGNLTIDAGGDGIQAYNADEEDKGYVSLEDGTIKITADQDGVQAENNLLVAGGNIDITTGGGSENSSSKDGWGQWGGGKPGEPMENNTTTTEDTTSAKAIKASSVIQIDDGSINIDSSDDSIHSNNKLIINNGDINLSSGDDGTHTDAELEINGGTLNITKSYEGIEGTDITINDGNIHVVASDDGLNAAGGADGSSTNGRPGQNKMESTTSGTATINGGYLVVDADGDGLDANGNLTMTGGTAIVNGPTNGGNGALDYDGEFNMSGGTLIAAGSLGMVQTPSSSSKLNTINVSLTSQEANTLIRVESENGDDVVTFSPTKTYSSVVICTPNIKSNETYKVYVGGSCSGEEKDGLYSGGSYTKGIEVGSSKISDVITSITQDGVSSNSNQPGGGGGNRDENMTPPSGNNSSMENM
ncbi:carbohydrate-binding domain-containing protein [Terrisporobacter vanillatitrophus]